MPKVRTIAELRHELEQKEKQLGKLASRREALLRELQKIDRQIGQIQGQGTATVRATARTEKSSARGQRATGTPLIQYVKDVLAKSADGLRVKDIAKSVEKAGYHSKSKDFYSIVAAQMQNDAFKRVGRGIYKLA